MTDPADVIDRWTHMAREGELAMSDADAKAFLRLRRALDREPGRRSMRRRKDILQTAKLVGENPCGLADVAKDRETVERLVEWGNQMYQPPNGDRLREGTTSWQSWKTYRKNLRTIGAVLNGETTPDSVAWVSTATPDDGGPSVHAEDLPGPEVIRRRMDACTHARDRALLAVAFDAGIRPQAALHKLTLGEVRDEGDLVTLTIRDDKVNGGREVALLWPPAREALRAWLRVHPGTSPGDPLWSRHRSPETVGYARLLAVFKEAAKRSETAHLATTPKDIQKASLKFWHEDQGLPLAVVNERMGRRRDSDATTAYLSDHDAAEQVAAFEQATGQTIDGAEGDGLAERLEAAGVDDPQEFVEIMAAVMENPRAASAFLASRHGNGSGAPVDGEAADLADLPQLPD